MPFEIEVIWNTSLSGRDVVSLEDTAIYLFLTKIKKLRDNFLRFVRVSFVSQQNQNHEISISENENFLWI